MIYVFGTCTLDTQGHVLQRAGQPVRLRRKVFQVLTYLLAHREQVIPKQELCDQVWPKQFISDAALESTIKAVRQAICDSGHRQQFIQTIYGQGYRFIAAVEERADASADPEDFGTSTLQALSTPRQRSSHVSSSFPV
jgi:DNA-binding winged helix-turn-helix (wHTH) protein